jgi:hypothetical protein
MTGSASVPRRAISHFSKGLAAWSLWPRRRLDGRPRRPSNRSCSRLDLRLDILPLFRLMIFANSWSFSLFTMKPGDRHFQAFGNSRHFVIHQIAILPLNPRDGRLVENDAPGSQAARQIVLRNRRFAFQARFPNPPADDVPARQLMGLFQNA